MTPPTALLPLAEQKLDEYTVTPGVLGFMVFALMGLALWVLLKSMTKQLKKIDFEDGKDNR
jgi:hypothetical protein